MKKVTALEILKDLIAIPSYVSDKVNEIAVANYIANFLEKFPWLTVERQDIGDKGRFNVIAFDQQPAKLLLYGHMDTVTLRVGNVRDQLMPIVEGNKLFGLGAADMKAGVAAILAAVQNAGPTKGLVLFFACDEEYYFLGAKEFLKKYSFQPRLILSAEPTNLEIANSCRGVLQCSFTVRGKTAHASTPVEGRNAIEGVSTIVNELKKQVKDIVAPGFGETTVNLAYLRGGLAGGKGNRVTRFANSIPDIAKVLLELRITDSSMTGAWLKSVLQKFASKKELTIEKFKTDFCVYPYVTDRSDLQDLAKIVGQVGLDVIFRDPSQDGYYETQLIWEKWKLPTASFGPGPSEGTHKSDEYVDLDQFRRCEEVYSQVIRDFAK